MRRILFLILCLFIFFGSAYAQRMSDEQVVEYVKQAQAAGKSQKQMTAELLRRGVTREQVLRIKDKYENSGVLSGFRSFLTDAQAFDCCGRILRGCRTG